MEELKFYRCAHCGNIVVKVVDSNVPVVCCGEVMKELTANTSDGATEKHVPVVTVNENHVHVVVGDVLHPMVAAHWIQLIVLVTDKGFMVKHLDPTDTPVAEFIMNAGEKAVAVYEYCNLHGLWKTVL